MHVRCGKKSNALKAYNCYVKRKTNNFVKYIGDRVFNTSNKHKLSSPAVFKYQHNTSWPCMCLLWICNSKLTFLLSISLSDNRIDPKSLPGSDSKEWEDLSYSNQGYNNLSTAPPKNMWEYAKEYQKYTVSRV